MKEKAKRPKISPKVQKQQLHDLEHLLSLDVGKFLVLNEEGTQKQWEQAKQKAHSDLLKFKGEMEQLAKEMGEPFPQAVHDFIASVNQVLDSADNWVDQAVVNEHYQTKEKLEKRLKN